MLAVPVQRMDPQLRKLLEVAYEAWIDSGINHLALRGSERVGPRSQGTHTRSGSACSHYAPAAVTLVHATLCMLAYCMRTHDTVWVSLCTMIARS